MRKIKFRAKSTQDYETSTDGIQKGEWIYGYYYFCRDRNCGIIITTLEAESGGIGSGLVQVEIEVDYKTVGQFIGLKTENGQEICEGDIIDKMVVSYCNGMNEGLGMTVGWYLQQDDWERWIELEFDANNEISGNIFENKELIEENNAKRHEK